MYIYYIIYHFTAGMIWNLALGWLQQYFFIWSSREVLLDYLTLFLDKRGAEDGSIGLLQLHFGFIGH
ncbi:hypothetical protein GCM10028868_30890 [Virgibacillus kimchii]